MSLIQRTFKEIRKQTIQTILDVYEGDELKLNKEDRTAKYKKMLRSPFHFYRGSAFLFYYDLAHLPLPYTTAKEHPTWIQGDLHFENFGAFQLKNGRIVFDTNDFDEGYLGSYLYDVVRSAVSIGLYATLLDFSEKDRKGLMEHYFRCYAEQLHHYTEGVDVTESVFTKDNTRGPVQALLVEVEGNDVSARLQALTEVKDGKRQFKRDTGLEPLDKEERDAFDTAWDHYIQTLDDQSIKESSYFQAKDVVKSFGAGIGSVGLKRYFILAEGETKEGQMDDIIIEAKEARSPASAYFFDEHEVLKENGSIHHGRRVIMTQKVMQHHEDPYLGWMTVLGHEFYLREHSAVNGELDTEPLKDYENMKQTVEIMAQITAKTHARADQDVHQMLGHQNEELILAAIGSDVQRFAGDMSRWAMHYKRQVELDYDLFKEWVKDEYDLTTN